MTADLPPRSRAVAEALAAAGIAPAIRELPDSARTAAEAAAVLGCPVASIANSLVFVHDGAPLLVMTSGGHQVDTGFLAGQLGGGPVVRATARQVREATGQAIGGVAPTGHPAPLRTVVDTALAGFPKLWAAAGTPHTVVPMTYEELVRLTSGTPLAVEPGTADEGFGGASGEASGEALGGAPGPAGG
ncbi:YbaK/EbsC family protein [Kitasatospora sp. NPDC048540]|uniref:YbaK/EbsC family protein n=1 Tax=Kitasatospora sp. NPDC048540 TaxID=3155634 RepID=UPI0033EE4B12